jgi:hypothetical protein
LLQIKKSSLFQDIEKEVPKWADLKALDNSDRVSAVHAANRNPPTLRCKNILLMPPLVTKTILELNTLDPASLIPNLIQTFKEFYSTSETVKSCTILHCKNILLIPPLVTKTILELNTLDPATLIPNLIQTFKEFYSTSRNCKIMHHITTSYRIFMDSSKPRGSASHLYS